MDSLYNILLSELPKIAEVIESFPEAQRDKAMDLLVEALKSSSASTDFQPTQKTTVGELKKQPVVVNEPVKRKADTVETEASKKLSRLRAKIFEKTTSGSVEQNEEQDSLKASLDELSVEELSNVVFYQKGQSTPLSDLL